MNFKATKFLIIFLVVFLLFGIAGSASAHMPRLVWQQKGDITVNNPENSQAFYDELTGKPRNYLISSSEEFNLYINLLVPEIANPNGRYQANIFSTDNKKDKLLYSISASIWNEEYEKYGRDYYLKGPEFDKIVPPGSYKVEVFSGDNLGKYVLVVGKKEVFPLPEALNIFWQLPLLKMQFFKTSVLEFFFTPFGIAGVAVVLGTILLMAVLNYLVAMIAEKIKNRGARTILLTSAGMQMKDEIIKLLQKPAYDIQLAFITTASKPEENQSFVEKDREIMKEMGFNIEEVDIEGKRPAELMRLLEHKDIIFVEGGNTFYLLKAIRKSGFEKVVRKLLKRGKVYIGVSAGSMVAGKTIKTSVWRSEAKGIDRNVVGLKNLKGMGLVPFDIFVHYTPEYAEIIKKKLPWKWQRRKLKILTDEQAYLVQGKERILIGKGEAIRL